MRNVLSCHYKVTAIKLSNFYSTAYCLQKKYTKLSLYLISLQLFPHETNVLIHRKLCNMFDVLLWNWDTAKYWECSFALFGH